MQNEIAYADGMLDAWASWVRQSLNAWPSQTLLGRIIKQGVSGAAQGGLIDTMPEQVARTDRAVAHIEQRLQRVTKVYYLSNAPSEVKAMRCGVSRATFWRLVPRAQLAVANELSNNYSERRETPNRYSQAFLQVVSH